MGAKLMDPATVATAIATIFLTKALEKSGEKFGESILTKANQAIAKIRKRSPEMAKLLEAGDPQVLDLGTAVLEPMEGDPIFAEVIMAADVEKNGVFKEKFQAVKAGGTINMIGKQINVTQSGNNNTQNNTFM